MSARLSKSGVRLTNSTYLVYSTAGLGFCDCDGMGTSIYQVAWLQGVLVLAGSAALYVALGSDIAISALTGGAVAFANAFIYASRFRRASTLAVISPQRAVGVIVKSVLIRTVLVATLFWFLLGWLKLPPAPAVLMFAAVQVTYWLALRNNLKD